VILTNEAGAASWPISRCDLHPDHKHAAGSGPPPTVSPQVLRLGYFQRRKMAEDLDFVPMRRLSSPPSEGVGGGYQGRSGKPLYAMSH